jgi:hypothetical protein
MHSLTSALDGGEWSASRPSRFISKERAPGTHWIGGWVKMVEIYDTKWGETQTLNSELSFKSSSLN